MLCLLTHASLLHHEDYDCDARHTHTALNSHQHVVLSPGLVTHQMQSTVETSILDIQIRRDRVIRDSDRRSAGVIYYLSVGYVYVGQCPVHSS